MMTVHGKMYIPVLTYLKTREPKRDADDQIIFLPVISSSANICRAKAAQISHGTWGSLVALGWRIREVEICADEREFYPGQDWEP
jgi:hypothetical protein